MGRIINIQKGAQKNTRNVQAILNSQRKKTRKVQSALNIQRNNTRNVPNGRNIQKETKDINYFKFEMN